MSPPINEEEVKRRVDQRKEKDENDPEPLFAPDGIDDHPDDEGAKEKEEWMAQPSFQSQQRKKRRQHRVSV